MYVQNAGMIQTARPVPLDPIVWELIPSGFACAECNHAPVPEREHEAWLFIVARTIMQIIAVTQDPFLLLLLLHFREYLCLWPFLHKKMNALIDSGIR